MQQSMEEDNISHISPYHVVLLYSVLSEHITADYVTTSFLRSTPPMNVLYAHMVLGLPFNVLVGYRK
jgi:hypothetical protein